MALARYRRSESGMNYWPGFVDALSTLILGIIFLLTVFVVVQFYLQQEVAGKDTALQRLNAQIAQLTDLLSMEKNGKADLEDQIAQSARLALGRAKRTRQIQGAGGRHRRRRRRRARQDRRAFRRARQPEADIPRARWRRSRCSTSRSPRFRRQLAALEQALNASEKKNTESQSRISELGQRLNVALAHRVQELTRYRSDFFGKLREILGNRPDVRIVGDRFVLQSEVFFDTGKADLKPDAQAELDKISRAIHRIGQADSRQYRLGAAGRRPYRRAADHRRAVQVELGPVGRARDRGGAISRREGRAAAAAGRRRLRRVPADRHRHHRRGLSPQPPHRVQADGAVSG